MSNFYQRKVAQESVGQDIVPDNTELPLDSVEGVLNEVASDTAAIDQMDSEAATLTEDADEVDAQFQQVDDTIKAADAGEEGVDEDMSDEAVTAVDVAQESIRRRWGLNHRQTLARESYGRGNRRHAVRESLWDDIKAFFRRIWEWLKTQGRKIKDRWINFHNQGKSIQKRSKKYDAAIRGLGSKKQDEIKGGFIKQLSENGSFVGSNLSTLNGHLTATAGLPAGVEAMLSEASSKTDQVATGAGQGGFTAKVNMPAFVKQFAGAGTHEQLGSKVVKVEVEGEDWNMTFIDSEKDVPSDVKTPGTSELNSMNTFYNKVGLEVEKRAKAYEKVNSTREKFESSIEKLLNKIDKVDAKDNESLVENIRNLRKEVNKVSSVVGVLEKVQANTITCLTSGVNGYLAAGIAAYDKRKG
jgi:hypothetical protein